MDFEFDVAKNRANLIKHGIDLQDAALVFLGAHRLDTVDDRRSYGEPRRIVVGEILGRVWVVVYTMRGDVHRLISARKANEREQRRYHALRG